MQVITIPNFRHYQHYQDKDDRKPFWIKLYADILQDEKIQQLKDNERWIYISLLVLASRHRNEIPADFDYIARNCSHTKRGIAGSIIRLKDLKLISIQRIAKVYTNSKKEKSRVENIKEEKNDASFNKSTLIKKTEIINNKERAELAEEVAKQELQQK